MPKNHHLVVFEKSHLKVSRCLGGTKYFRNRSNYRLAGCSEIVGGPTRYAFGALQDRLCKSGTSRPVLLSSFSVLKCEKVLRLVNPLLILPPPLLTQIIKYSKLKKNWKKKKKKSEKKIEKGIEKKNFLRKIVQWGPLWVPCKFFSLFMNYSGIAVRGNITFCMIKWELKITGSSFWNHNK